MSAQTSKARTTKANTAKAGRPVDHAKDRAILRAAREIIFAEGPQALTMESVAERAGVSKVTVYARYTNRLQLLQAVVEGEAFMLTRSLEHLPATRAELGRDLCVFIEGVSAFLCSRRHQRLMQAIGSVPQRGADLAHVYRNGPDRAHQMLADYLTAVSALGLIHCPEPWESAELLFGMMLGLDLFRAQYRLPATRRSPQDRSRHARRVAQAFLAIHSPARNRPAPQQAE